MACLYFHPSRCQFFRAFARMVLASMFPCAVACAAPQISVAFDREVAAPELTGRIVVFLVAADSGLDPKALPIDGPFWKSQQPLFGLDIRGWRSDEAVEINDQADAYPFKPSALKPGRYRAQACLIARRLESNWKRVAGNLYSDPGELVINGSGDGAVRLTLGHRTSPPERVAHAGVEWFSLPSKILTGFRQTPTELRAGVVLPLEYDPTRTYSAIYRIPGFGGNDLDAARAARERSESTGPARELAKETFLIVLDPEGPNGHSLFADSANNGPCGRALIEELIPALEQRFPLIAHPGARVLQGHSSGGWSSLWLALTKPDVFGAAWSTAPDPVDFRKFQTVNIYEDPNFYSAEAKAAPDRPSFRELDRTTGEEREVMTIRREARQEDVLGPDNTSGQQWDSWFAAFGPRDRTGCPAPLFDPLTGVIDRAIAEQYRAFDVASLLRSDAARYLPVFRRNIRLIVGEADNFYLNEAVALLQADVLRFTESLAKTGSPAEFRGYIKIVPGRDHGSILRSAEVRAAPSEMLDHLRAAGHAR